MYSIALPTGWPPIYSRIQNKVAWTTELKRSFGGMDFESATLEQNFIDKFPNQNRFWQKKNWLGVTFDHTCEIKLTNHWSFEVQIQSEHWSFFLLLKVWANDEPRKAGKSVFGTNCMYGWLRLSCTGVKFTCVGVILRFEAQSNKYIIKLPKLKVLG